MDLGPHGDFIIASYALVIVIVGTMIGWAVFDGRRQKRALADLEARGVRRRSQR